MIRQRKVIGIIGGMGPMATADLFVKIIKNTRAETDQEHLPVLIDNNTAIPDRTACIRSGSDAPIRPMAESARRLAAAGADVLLIPCNTAHFYYGQVQAAVEVPVLNMPEITAEYCAARGVACAGLLATSGTLDAGVYDPYFAQRGIGLLRPAPEGVEALMHLIYREVKAGLPPHPEKIYPCLQAMKQQGAEAFLLACTELPLVFSGAEPLPFIDPTLLLARAAVLAAGGTLTQP